MRKKIEEELAKLAFGDLDADAAQRLELQTQADPEASKTFESYCRMKNELRSLCTDVPDDQLSKDRLREAILTRGLKEHRPVSRLSWLWMPAAAAVLAFSFVALKGRIPTGGNSVGPMVMDYTSGKLPNTEGIGVVRPDASDAVASNLTRTKVVVDKEPTKVAMNTERPQRDRRSLYEQPVDRGADGSVRMSAAAAPIDFEKLDSPLVSDASLVTHVDFGPSKESESREEKKQFDMRDQVKPISSGVSQPKIVLITSETDANTGTLKATEVESTANVLVGG